MQYNIGNVNVVQGSVEIEGLGSLWLGGEISPGDLFTVHDSGLIYEVQLITGNGNITLTSEYVGVSLNSVSYIIHRDFTANLLQPLLSPGDAELPTLWNWKMKVIDQALTAFHLSLGGGAPDLPSFGIRDLFSRISEGKVSVTNTSQTVTGDIDTRFLNTLIPALFTLDLDSFVYQVGEIVADDDLTILRRYDQATQVDVDYFLSKDFSPHFDFCLMSGGEVDASLVFTNSINKIAFLLDVVYGLS